MHPMPVVLVGAGQRGAEALSSYALRRPEEIRIVAIAEPDEMRRERFAQAHNIPERRRFHHWQDLFNVPLMADLALICTPNDLHVAPTLMALENGYHVLVETPMAQNPAHCLQMIRTAELKRRHLFLAHQLRYTAFYRALKDIVRSGRLGQIITYHHQYMMAHWHSTHRFVRGNERRSDQNPLILTAGSHEFDLLLWLLNDDIETISSVGALTHFKESSAPIANVPARCVDHCPIEHECPFSAIGIYLEKRFPEMPQSGWLFNMLTEGEDAPDAILRAVENSPYGRCVYHCDNDVLDHQAVILQTHSGISATMTLSSNSLTERRLITLEGSHGSITADFCGLESHISIAEHGSEKKSKVNFRIGINHGGDHGLMGGLYKILRQDAQPFTLAAETWHSHLLGFAAEESRHTQQIIHFPTYEETQFKQALSSH